MAKPPRTKAKKAIEDVVELLPHRYPMLLIDKLVRVSGDMEGVAVKNVTHNEPFFAGHFPGHPVMPGALIVEALGQTAVALYCHQIGRKPGQVVYLATIERARFRHPVVPGDVLELHVRCVRRISTIWKFHGEAKVGVTLVADADYSAIVVETGKG